MPTHRRHLAGAVALQCLLWAAPAVAQKSDTATPKTPPAPAARKDAREVHRDAKQDARQEHKEAKQGAKQEFRKSVAETRRDLAADKAQALTERHEVMDGARKAFSSERVMAREDFDAWLSSGWRELAATRESMHAAAKDATPEERLALWEKWRGIKREFHENARAKRQEMRQDGKEARQELRETKHEAMEQWQEDKGEARQEARSEVEDAKKKKHAELEAARQEHRDARQDARQEHRDAKQDARQENRDARQDTRKENRDSKREATKPATGSSPRKN